MPFVPDNPAQKPRFTPDTPAAPSAAAAGPRLGPTASGLVRGPLEGLTGVVTGIPDLATMIGNTTGNLIDKGGQALGAPAGFMGPDVKSPGASVQELIDKFTTAPTSRSGKLMETLNAILYGSMAGPKVKVPNNVNPVVKRLAQEGVTMTPGQRAGGLANKVEEKAGAIFPSVKNARGRAMQDWNTAEVNKALHVAGAKPVPAGVSGQAALKHAKKEMQARYTAVLSKMRADAHAAPGPNPAGSIARPGVPQPGSFLDSVQRVKAVGANLDRAYRRELDRVLDTEVAGRFTSSGKASGETIQRIGEALDENIRSFGNQPNYQERKLIQAYRQVQKDLTDMLMRQNPKVAPEYKKLEEGYARYKTSIRSAVKAPTQEGRYTPGQRLAAIKARDKSPDKERFAMGEAPGQSEAQEAHSVLGNTLPDSGTPQGMALLEAGKLASHPLLSLGVGGLPLVYSPAVLKKMQEKALQDPKVSRLLGILGGAQQAPSPLAPQQDSQ